MTIPAYIPTREAVRESKHERRPAEAGERASPVTPVLEALVMRPVELRSWGWGWRLFMDPAGDITLLGRI